MKKSLLCLLLAFVLCFNFAGTVLVTEARSTAAKIDADIPTSLSVELQGKERNANDKYNELLKYWAYDLQYFDDVNANFPSFYSGAYINDTKDLVIQVTTLNEDIKKYFSEIIDISNVVFDVVRYSYSELKEEHKNIVRKLDPNSENEMIASISGVGISFPKNAVNLYVDASKKGAETTQFVQNVKSSVSTFDNIEIVITSGKDTTCALVEPGTQIKNGVYNRSVGFWAYDGEDNLGIITAPHTTITEGDTINIGTRIFGTAKTPYFSGSTDAVFIERTNSYFTATRYVSGWDFNLSSNSYTILSVGSTTYSKGIESGCQMGKVTDTNYTTTYGISNCVVTEALGALGDSGGIVAGSGSSSTRYVAGIITGKQGGTNYIIYVKAVNILSSLDASIY